MRKTLASLTILLMLTACSPDKEAVEPIRQAEGIGSVTDSTGRARPDFPALEFALENDPARVIPAEALELVGGEDEYRKGIPEGADFTVQPDTWELDGTGGTVRIDMSVDGEVVLRSIAVMLQDSRGLWFLLQTIPLDEYLDSQPSPTPSP